MVQDHPGGRTSAGVYCLVEENEHRERRQDRRCKTCGPYGRNSATELEMLMRAALSVAATEAPAE